MSTSVVKTVTLRNDDTLVDENNQEVPVVLYTSGPVSLKERLMFILNKLIVKQVKEFLSFVGSKSFYFLCSLHNNQYNKSILFILCLVYHTALPQFVSFLSNFVQSRIYVSFLSKSTDLKFLQRRSKFSANLRAQASQGGFL